MRRLIYTVAILLAACGGHGEPAVEYGPAGDTPREQPLNLDLVGAFSRASPGFVQDFEGTWIPLDIDEPGYPGGRRVKNLFLNSGDASLWRRMADSKSTFSAAGAVGRITHAQGQNGSPYFMALVGPMSDPGAMPASLFASRVTARIVAGPCAQRFTWVGRTNGTGIGSESNNAILPVSNCNWHTFSQTAQLLEQHSGLISTLLTQSTVAKAYELTEMQFEDQTGARTPISSEYCPSTTKPGVCWFAGAPTTSRPGALFDGFTASNAFAFGGGLLTDGPEAPLFTGAIQQEPASKNTILWNTHEDIGVAVVDSSSNNYPQAAPGLSCTDYVLTDPRSGRYVYNRNDFTVAGSTITSKTTDLGYFHAGTSVWMHVGGQGSWGPFRVLASGPRTMTVDGTWPALPKATKLNLHRVPQPGDPIMIRRNNNAMHHTSVVSVLLPSIGAAAADGYQHMSLRVQLADPFPCDGINSGRVGNENQPVYFGRDLVYDIAAIRAAGLGYLARNGLVQAVSGAHDFGGTGYTGSAWVKGTGSLCVGPDCTPFNTSSYQRVAAAGVGALSVIGSALVAVPQLEPLPFASSPIVTQGAPATRAATVIDTGSN